jgi:hypothetical protein
VTVGKIGGDTFDHATPTELVTGRVFTRVYARSHSYLERIEYQLKQSVSAAAINYVPWYHTPCSQTKIFSNS